MKIGIFSDTHDNVKNIAKARKVFERNEVEICLFCGDLVSPSNLKVLKNWPFPIKAIFGNNEGDHWGIARRFKQYNITNIEYPKRGLSWKLELDSKKIATFHGHSPVITEALTNCGIYDLVCTGHDHEPKIKQVEKTLWVNPGSVTGWSENPEITRGSVVVYDTQKHEAKIIYLP